MTTIITSETYDADVLDWPVAAGEHGTVAPLYAQLRKGTPARLRMPSGDVFWLFTRRDDIEAILTDRRFSRDLTRDDAPRLARGPDFQSVTGGIFNIDPPRHTAIRRVVNPFYTPAVSETRRATIHDKALELIEAMQTGPVVADLVTAYAEPLALHMSATILNIPAEIRAAYNDVFRTQFDYELDRDTITDAVTVITDLADRVVAHHEATPDGPVGALVRAGRDGTLSADEVRGTVAYLLITAAEPIMGPVPTFVITLLREQPQRTLHTLRTTPDLWPNAISELLRLHNNGQISLPRLALEDVEIGGVLVRRGEAVINPHLAATTDPAHVQNPNHLNIRRRDQTAMTFGCGPHYCLGSSLTRVYLHEALQTLMERLPDLTLAVNATDVPWMPPETLFTRPRRLPVTW